MKNKTVLALCAAAALTVGGLLAVNQARAAEARRESVWRGPTLERIISGLGLTEDQVAKIKAELRPEKDTIVSLLKRLHTSRQELRDAIHANTDEASIRAASAKVAAVEADLALERAKLHQKIAPILTAEQIQKVQAFEEKMDDFVTKAIKAIGEKLEAQ